MAKIFYIVSLIISYFIISEGAFYFAWWMLIAIPVFALWLNVPFFFNDSDKNELAYTILGYLIWVVIQWAIYYYGFGPPEGAGIPHFL